MPHLIPTASIRMTRILTLLIIVEGRGEHRPSPPKPNLSISCIFTVDGAVRIFLQEESPEEASPSGFFYLSFCYKPVGIYQRTIICFPHRLDVNHLVLVFGNRFKSCCVLRFCRYFINIFLSVKQCHDKPAYPFYLFHFSLLSR